MTQTGPIEVRPAVCSHLGDHTAEKLHYVLALNFAIDYSWNAEQLRSNPRDGFQQMRALMRRRWCWPAPGSAAGRALNWVFKRVRRSRLSARLRFGLAYAERSSTGRAYYDTTTVALKRVLEPRVRANPYLKLLEIGAGPYAVLCGRLSRLTRRRVDALEVRPVRVESAIRHVQQNGFNVRVFESDLLDGAESRDYDLIFWNLPYYSDPAGYLPRLFAQVASHLSSEGELVLGTYNAALPGEVILRFLNTDAGVVLRSHDRHWWGQEVLTFSRTKEATDAPR